MLDRKCGSTLVVEHHVSTAPRSSPVHAKPWDAETFEFVLARAVRATRGDQQAVHPAVPEALEVASEALVSRLHRAGHQRRSRGRRGRLGALDDLTVGGVGVVGDKQRNRLRPRRPQAARGGVRLVVQLLDR